MIAGEAARPLALRLVRVHVPLRTAHRSAHGEEAVRDSVLVCWTSAEGVEGWGECPTLAAPGYVTETTDEAWAGLVGQLGSAALAGRMPPPLGLVASVGALADAALDARLRGAGRSLADELGATRDRVPVGAVLAGVGESADALAAAAAAAVAAGAALVKVKVAPGRDLDVLRAVADAVPGTPVAADANGSYPDAEAVVALERALGDVRLAYLEQPLAAGATPDELAGLRGAIDTPVALDESLTSLDAVATALRAGAVDVLSLKPARLGGVARAAAAVGLCRDAGRDAFVGGMFELGVGRASAAAVAALPGCTLPTDLGPSDRYVAEDVTEAVTVDDDGLLVVPDGPGCGRSPLPERLAEVTVDEVLLTA